MMTAQKGKTVKKKSSSPLIKKEKTGDKDFVPPFTPAERKKMPKVSNMGSAKNGKAMKKSFPDLNKDGKITKADILKGRGVIAKRGATIKKAQNGNNVIPRNLNKRQLERVQRINETNPERSRKVANRISDRRNARGAENLRMNGDAQFNMKSGGKIKTCKNGCK